MNKLKTTINTSTDLLYEQLADPTKLQPLKQTAKIVSNNDSEGEDSYVYEMNNNPNKTSPSLKFNPDQNNKLNISESSHGFQYKESKDSKESKESKESIDLYSNETSSDDLQISNKNKISERNNTYNNKKKYDSRSSDKKISSNKNSSSDKKQNGFGNYSSRLSSRSREQKQVRSSDNFNDIKNEATVNKLKIDLDNYDSDDDNNTMPHVKPISSFYPSNQQQSQAQPQVQTFNNTQYQQQNMESQIPKVIPIATQKELKFKKMETLTKLLHIKSIGIELTKNYSMESDIEEMQAELKYHTDIQSKKDGVKLAKSFMCNAITGLEFLNERYDPFGFKLKGWSDQVKMNKDDYDEVFGELLEKYKTEGKKMEPELKLALMLILSAGSFHMSQSIATGLPGVDDVIKNNPQLLAKIQSGINKSISGPSELEKKKALYDNVKKMHEQKVNQRNQVNKPDQTKQVQNKQVQNKPELTKQVQNKPVMPVSRQQSVNRPSSVSKTMKPTSVKNLLNNIKKSVPVDSASNSYSITLGDTVETETDTSSQRPSVSQGVKTKSRLQGRNKIEFQSN